MQLDDLRSRLADAVDIEPAADLTAGRHAIDRRIHRHQTRRVTAIAVAALVLFGGVGIRLGTGQNDNLPVISGPSLLSRLTPTYVPEGAAFAGVLSLPATDVMGPGTNMLEGSNATFVYASGTGPDAVNGESFAVVVARFDMPRVAEVLAEARTRGTGALPTELTAKDLVESFVQRFQQTVMSGGRVATRSDPGRDHGIFVVSRTLSDATLQQIAASIQLDATATEVEVIDLPAGFQPVARSTSLGIFELGQSAVSFLTEGSMINYTFRHDPGRDSDKGYVRITALPGHGKDLDALRWFLPDEVPMRLHGQDGVAGTFLTGTTTTSGSSTQETAINPDGSSSGGSTQPQTTTTTEVRGSVVAWAEPDGMLMVIQAEHYSFQEMQKVADSLRDIGDPAWQTFRTTPTTLPSNCRKEGQMTICGFLATGQEITPGSTIVSGGTTVIPPEGSDTTVSHAAPTTTPSATTTPCPTPQTERFCAVANAIS